MIRSFGERETEKIWEGDRSNRLPTTIQQAARRKLRMINNSLDVNDLRVPPGNRLETLKGNLEGFYSIRINNQWRIIFRWRSGDAYEVEIVDYH